LGIKKYYSMIKTKKLIGTILKKYTTKKIIKALKWKQNYQVRIFSILMKK